MDYYLPLFCLRFEPSKLRHVARYDWQNRPTQWDVHFPHFLRYRESFAPKFKQWPYYYWLYRHGNDRAAWGPWVSMQNSFFFFC